MAKEDFYKVLGVKKDAKPDEIKKAYRRLARKYHPDVNPGDKAAEDRFKQMSEAFDVLSDPKKRKVYDRFGQYSDNLAHAAEAGAAAGDPRGGGCGSRVPAGRRRVPFRFFRIRLGRGHRRRRNYSRQRQLPGHLCRSLRRW